MLINSQSITLYALYISSSGWFAPVTSKSIDVENINNYYTGLEVPEEGSSSFGYYFDNYVNYNKESTPLFSTARRNISIIDLMFWRITDNGIVVDRGQSVSIGASKSISRGRMLAVSNQINSMVGVIGLTAADGVDAFKYVWMIYDGGGYNYAARSSIAKAFNSYTLQNAIYWGLWRDGVDNVGMYSAIVAKNQIQVGYILKTFNGYVNTNTTTISLTGNMNLIKAILIETETITGSGGDRGMYAKIVLLSVLSSYEVTLYYVKIRCYNSGSTPHIVRVGDVYSYKSVNRPMGANVWITTDRKWMFFPPYSGNSFYPKGLNSYYANGQQLIVDDSPSMPDNVSYLNSSHTSSMRSALQNVYVLEILFNKTQTKMIVLTNTTGAAFEIGNFEGNYNPDAMYCFQLVNNSWVQISTQVIDRQNVFTSYNSTGNQGIKYKSSLSLCDKSNDLDSLAMFGSQYSFNWAFPAGSKPIVFYTSKITWGE